MARSVSRLMGREQPVGASVLVEATDSKAFHKLTDKRQVGHWAVQYDFMSNGSMFGFL